ncbi:MAG: LacI family DNA-binding transcriptional regulator [Nocardioides sp.]
MAKVTLQSIADRVGVSRMTVSNAFSRPDQLSATLRERILAAAVELGYDGPDPAARALARGRTGAVGLLLDDRVSHVFRDPVAAHLVASIADRLAEHGRALTLLALSDDDAFRPARDVAVDGVLVFTSQPDSPDIAAIERRRLPMVTIDQRPRPGAPGVEVDERVGARQAAEHLVGLGHTRIGVLTLQQRHREDAPADDLSTLSDDHPARERLAAWRAVLASHGIEPTVRLAPFGSVEAAQQRARDLLSGPERPTAVLCYSDVFAQGVQLAAAELALRVPDDLSLIGFDDGPLASALRPALTTVRQDVDAKGRAAVDALVALLEGRDAASVVLPTELIRRASTGPAPI